MWGLFALVTNDHPSKVRRFTVFVNFLTALNIDFCLLLANCQFSSGKFSRNKASKNIEQLQIDEHKNVKIIFVYLFECLFAQQIKKISLVTRKKFHDTMGSKSFWNRNWIDTQKVTEIFSYVWGITNHCTEVDFVWFLSGGFTTMAVTNPSDWKLANRIFVHLSDPCSNLNFLMLSLHLALFRHPFPSCK